MKAVNDDVLVKEDASVEKLTAGGLIIPSIGTIPMAYGTVEQIGPGRYNPWKDMVPKIDLQIGDYVIYNPGPGKDITTSVVNADKTVTKTKLKKLNAMECMAVLEQDKDGKMIGVKNVRENYLVVKREENDKKTIGGIYVPEWGTDGKLMTGRVVMRGPGKYNAGTDSRIPCCAEIGDRIVFIDIKAIQINLPEKNEKGEIVKEKFYLVPDSQVEVILDENENF